MDKRLYSPGENVSLALTVDNLGDLNLTLFSRVRHGDYDTITFFNVTPHGEDPGHALLCGTLSQIDGVTGARGGEEAMVDPSCTELLRHRLTDLGSRTAPGGGIQDDVDGFAQRCSP